MPGSKSALRSMQRHRPCAAPNRPHGGRNTTPTGGKKYMTKTNAVGNDESNHGKGWTPRSERREAQAFVHSSTEHLPLSSTSARAVDVYAGEKPANPELLQRLQVWKEKKMNLLLHAALKIHAHVVVTD